jgi:carbonic anhydrase
LIPPCGRDGHSTADESEAAAIEFALMQLNVSDIIVCGHSDCGAMHALIAGRDKVVTQNLRAWLRHGEPALRRLPEIAPGQKIANQLSQLNVLQQIEHLRSYPVVQKRLAEGRLGLHAWWFELKTANVYCYEETLNKFVVIDEEEAARILERLSV